MDHPRLTAFALAGLASLLCCQPALAAPLLRCTVSYAGASQVVEATPVSDPYPVPSVDIGGRFRFKAVMVGSAARVDRVVLYAYLVAGAQPVLVLQARHLPPFQTSAAPYLLTGEQRVYAGPVERELIYSCTLQGVQS